MTHPRVNKELMDRVAGSSQLNPRWEMRIFSVLGLLGIGQMAVKTMLLDLRPFSRERAELSGMDKEQEEMDIVIVLPHTHPGLTAS